MNKALALFHPLIQQWFTERFGSPTEVQCLAWPKIAHNDHLLITAPTGSGKTLTAFLWALDRLIRGTWECGKTRILYISPLKALNTDIQRNLIVPLTALRSVFEHAGEPFPNISVMTRSGDTDSTDRARMLRTPPEILITTPESLNLLVGSIRGRSILTHLETVILDEIHSVADNKRGTHLITAVDRLVPLAGEFQRIALSATVRPLQTIAEWVGGRRLQERDGEIAYTPRNVEIVDCQQIKKIQLRIQYPDLSGKSKDDPTFWTPLVQELKQAVRRNRSTLIFTNNRRLCERISFMLNQDEPEKIAYAHHGSLSRETRTIVEKRLKEGSLAAIVATSSLELGIDIGALDEVLLVQTPPSIAAALQRVGRAGHGVGQTSRGVLFPTHPRDVVDAAVICKSMMERDIEEIRPIECPLDILAQIVTSMSAIEQWEIDRLFEFLQTSAPYFHLQRSEFDRVLAMLSGQYSSKRLRHIAPLISIDRIDRTLQARNGALQKVYMEGGTIPDHGYFTLRHRDTRSKIGELDEEFVWERRLGDTFMLGTQVWKIHQITHNDVFAFPTDEPANIAPFWQNEQFNRNFYSSEKIGLFLEQANREFKKKPFRQTLLNHYSMDEGSADTLLDFLKRQKENSHCDLPHRHHLLIEYTHIPGGRSDWRHGIFHTGWGGRVNQPLALILTAALEKRTQKHVDTFSNNDGILMSLTEEISLSELILSIQPCDVEKWLRTKLESSGFFGARFRENASRALLLPKGKFGQRTPRWLHRLRSKELLEAIAQFNDFPILLETWRTCLRDEFDLDALQRVLSELQTGEIRISETTTPVPTPFAGSLVWIQTNSMVYIDDQAFSDRPSALRDELIQEIVTNANLRPGIPSELICQLEERLQRRIPGYAPDSAQELLDWVKERLLIPHDEWQALQKIMRQNEEIDFDEIVQSLSAKIVVIDLPNGSPHSIVALECIPRLFEVLELSIDEVRLSTIAECESSLDILPSSTACEKFQISQRTNSDVDEEITLADWLGQWLSFYGPIPQTFISQTLGLSNDRLDDALETLVEEDRIAIGEFRKENTIEEICDRQNLERLLRLLRREAVPPFSPIPVESLPLYLAHQQGLTHRGETLEDLQRTLEPLLGYAAPAEIFEREILPARMAHYLPVWMDELTRDSDLLWLGCGKQTIQFCFRDQIDWLLSAESQNLSDSQPKSLFPDNRGKFDFSQLLEYTQVPSSKLTEALWDAVWHSQASNDSFSALRKGIETKFKASEIPLDNTRGRRAGFGRWKSSRPFAGNWFALESPITAEDSLEELERKKECVRLLLDRYGILFRELIQRESPALRWGVLFKALWLMELSGELIGGYFFEGVPGIQFLRPSALRTLQEKWPKEEPIYWLNATDPVSLCGVAIEQLKEDLPPRRPTNHIVYHGTKIVLISLRQGKELDIRVPPDCPDLPHYFGLFGDWLNRSFQPMKSISIERINGHAAAESPYLPPLQTMYNAMKEYKKVILRKVY